MAVNDIYELALTFTNPGADGDMVNVLHYRQTEYDTTSSDAEMLDECMDLLITEIEDNYMPLLATDFTFARIDGFIVNKPLVGTTVASGDSGGDGGEYLPLRSTPIASKITGLRGRSYRGRIFGMSVLEASQNGGGWAATPKATMQTALDGWLELENFLGTNTWKMTLYSATLSTPPTIYIDNIVTSLPLRQVFGTIKGRQKVA